MHLMSLQAMCVRVIAKNGLKRGLEHLPDGVATTLHDTVLLLSEVGSPEVYSGVAFEHEWFSEGSEDVMAFETDRRLAARVKLRISDLEVLVRLRTRHLSFSSRYWGHLVKTKDLLVRPVSSLTRVSFTGQKRLSGSRIAKFLRLLDPHALRWLSLNQCTEMSREHIKSSVKRFVNLDTLDVGFCKNLTGVDVADVLEHCQRIRWLSMEMTSTSSRQLECEIAPRLSPEMHTLDISGLDVGSKALKAVAEACPCLERLLVSHTKITPAGLLCAANRPLANLHTLSLQGMGGNLPLTSMRQVFAQLLPQLAVLDLSHWKQVRGVVTALIEAGPDTFPLQELRLAHSSTSDREVLMLLPRCPELVTLDLSHTKVSGGTLAALAECTANLAGHLQCLHLDWIRAPGHAFAELAACSQLAYLSCEGTRIGTVSVKAIALGCPLLGHVNLGSCRNIPVETRATYFSSLLGCHCNPCRCSFCVCAMLAAQ